MALDVDVPVDLEPALGALVTDRVTLQLKPSFAPSGTRPSMPGCSWDPGPHGTSGVASDGGSGGCSIAAGVGDSPLPLPMANKSLTGWEGSALLRACG